MKIWCIVALLCSAFAAKAELSFKDQCLYWHNYYRRLHQAGPLVWSNDLQRQAQVYADELAAKDSFGNDGSSSVVAWPGNPGPKLGERSVKFVYNEETQYNYNSPGYSYYTGHFTVMVWNSTEELGAAHALSQTGRAKVVFKYRPIGNIQGRFRDNVLPKIVGLPLCDTHYDKPVTQAPCLWPSTLAPTNGTMPTNGTWMGGNTTKPDVIASAVRWQISIWVLSVSTILSVLSH
ncbi:predicted protein [Nematostella vectensis]|uniref:SCP domain-containing protein n=1 Tax=Nematostella vectensis TaxID=45351 RepID=A7S0K8_NEMVE|nr:predicted protein [Nematostella vectensis]|eukprot:XP_001634817.1 predicted protein [Nematostella vectensis]